MKRYSDAQSALILARAAELSTRKPIVERDGSSLEELELVAREAGLDVAAVRHAALDLAALDVGDDRGADGLVSTGIHLSADVDGTIDDAGRQAVLHEVRARFPLARVQPSNAGLLIAESPFGLFMSIASSGAHTHVVLDWNRYVVPRIPKKVSFAVAVAASLFMATLGDTLVEAAILAGGAAMISAFAFALAWVCRPIEPIVTRRRRARLTKALDGVVTVLRAHASPAPNSTTSA